MNDGKKERRERKYNFIYRNNNNKYKKNTHKKERQKYNINKEIEKKNSRSCLRHFKALLIMTMNINIVRRKEKFLFKYSRSHITF